MRKMTVADFDNLKNGDPVYCIQSGRCDTFKFIGAIKNYGYAADGTRMKHFYRPQSTTVRKIVDTDVIAYWYVGDFDKEFVGRILLKRHEDMVELTKKLYFETEQELGV